MNRIPDSKSQSRQSTKLFLQSSELGSPPRHPHASVPSLPSPPLVRGGGGTHSLAGEGMKASRSNEGHIMWYARNIYVMYFVAQENQREGKRGRKLRERWITITSSLNEIFKDQLEKRVAI
jgi:hypothetical protein